MGIVSRPLSDGSSEEHNVCISGRIASILLLLYEK